MNEVARRGRKLPHVQDAGADRRTVYRNARVGCTEGDAGARADCAKMHAICIGGVRGTLMGWAQEREALSDRCEMREMRAACNFGKSTAMELAGDGAGCSAFGGSARNGGSTAKASGAQRIGSGRNAVHKRAEVTEGE